MRINIAKVLADFLKNALLKHNTLRWALRKRIYQIYQQINALRKKKLGVLFITKAILVKLFFLNIAAKWNFNDWIIFS